MEHRWNARTEVNATITVHLPNSGAIQAVVKNVSRSGMLLDTRQFEVMRGGVVELAYTVARKLEREIVRLKALIVHGGDGLAGIMFIEHAGSFAALLDYCAGHALTAARHDDGLHHDKPGRAAAQASA